MLILFYDYVADIAERRAPHRSAHLSILEDLHARGVLLMAGAFAGPLDGAALVFNTDEEAEVERFVAGDPYVVNGLVKAWRIRKWTVVIGAPEPVSRP